MDDIRQHTYRNLWPFLTRTEHGYSQDLACEWHWALGPCFYVGGPLQHRERILASRLSDDDKAVALAAIDAFEALRPGPHIPITSASLEPFRIACASRSGYEAAFLLLVRLAVHAEAAAELLRSLMADRSAEIRRRVLTYLNTRVPADLAAEFVLRGLNDRSSRVREFAADAAVRRGLVELQGELARRAEVDPQPKVRRAFAHAAAMLLPGHRVEHLGDSWTVTVRHARGSTGRFFDHEPTPADIDAMKAEIDEKERRRKAAAPPLPPDFA